MRPWHSSCQVSVQGLSRLRLLHGRHPHGVQRALRPQGGPQLPVDALHGQDALPPARHCKHPGHTWARHPVPPFVPGAAGSPPLRSPCPQCPGGTFTPSMKSTKDYPDEVINFMRSHPLMYHAVYPAHRQPLVVRTNVNYRFTTIAVDQVDAADGRYEVLFLGTGTHAAHRRERSMLQRGLGGRQGPIPCPAVRPRTPPSSLVPPLSPLLVLGLLQSSFALPLPRCPSQGTTIQPSHLPNPAPFPVLGAPSSSLVLPLPSCPSWSHCAQSWSFPRPSARPQWLSPRPEWWQHLAGNSDTSGTLHP